MFQLTITLLIMLCLQALAAAMRKLQEEWWLLVVQLEHQQLLGQLSLAGLVYYCQAPAASLELLATIAVGTVQGRLASRCAALCCSLNALDKW